MKSRVLSTAALILGLALVGCGGPPEPPVGTVSGDVTLDDKPVSEGFISFFAAGTGTKRPTGKAQITAGKYSAAGVLVGETVVEVSSATKIYQPDPKKGKNYKPKPEELDPELIPAKYNKNTILKITVKEGENKEDFHLKSDPPAGKKK